MTRARCEKFIMKEEGPEADRLLVPLSSAECRVKSASSRTVGCCCMMRTVELQCQSRTGTRRGGGLRTLATGPG